MLQRTQKIPSLRCTRGSMHNSSEERFAMLATNSYKGAFLHARCISQGAFLSLSASALSLWMGSWLCCSAARLPLCVFVAQQSLQSCCSFWVTLCMGPSAIFFWDTVGSFGWSMEFGIESPELTSQFCCSPDTWLCLPQLMLTVFTFQIS